MKCCYCECELTEDNMGSETTCIMCHEMFEKEFDSQFDVMIDDTENM